MKLHTLGWNKFLEKSFEYLKVQGLKPGRVVKETRQLYRVYCEEGQLQAEVSGHFHYTAVNKSDYPTVGDWVALRIVDTTAMIEKVLPRRSAFSRKAAGNETEEQVVAANIDYLCIVCGLDGGRNFNLRGIERYLAMARDGGAKPVMVLNKVDLCTQRQEAFLQARSVGGDIPVYLVSALDGEGTGELGMSFGTGSTVAFAGPSGVGKSALINKLMGEDVQATGSQRDSDRRGRHTTTHKELFFLEGGAMVIDTPGMRELQLWGSEEGLENTFSEIYEAAKNCRFRDCTHQGEPGCRVEELLAEGGLDPKRYQNYLNMRAELNYLESRVSEKGRLERKNREKQLSRIIKKFNKKRD